MSKRICIFGDSIVWGANDNELWGWSNRLMLWAAENSIDISVYNLGVSGDSTNNLKKRFVNDCEAREPDIIIVSIGINDSAYLHEPDKMNVSLADFENNIQFFIDEGKKFTKYILFLSTIKPKEEITTPIPWETSFFHTVENAKLYSKTIKDVASNNNYHYIDIFDMIVNYLEDGIHPNANGHQKIFEKVRNELIDKNIIKL